MQLHTWHALAAVVQFCNTLALSILLGLDPPSCWQHEWRSYSGRKLYCIEIMWLLPIFCGLSMLHHVLAAFHGWGDTETYICLDSSPAGSHWRAELRWTEYTVSAACMTWMIAVMSGQRDLAVLASLSLLNIVLQSQGYLLDYIMDVVGSHLAKTVLRIIFAQAWAVHIATWSIIISAFHSSLYHASEKVPDLVYAIVYVLFTFYNLFGLVPLLRAEGCVEKRHTYEVAYILLSITSKSCLAWMVYGGATRDNAQA
jgi:hypothetical protein